MSRKQVVTFCETHGVELDDNTGLDIDLSVWTPPGFQWKVSGCHGLAVHYYSDKPAAWRELWQDVKRGLEPCDVLAEQGWCEGCHGDEQEEA